MEEMMRSFIAACVVAIVIAIVGALVLNAVQEPAEVAFTSASGVRI
jgi:cell division protein FtsN